MKSPIKYLFAVYKDATDDEQQAIVQAADDMMRGSMWSPKTFHLVQNAFERNGYLDTLDFQEVQELAHELCR